VKDKRRVLIVEDHRAVSEFLRAGLESMGEDFEITNVPSGEEAMLVLSRQPIDLMVIDIRLPGISGFELVEKAQARVPDLKYILITGMEDPNLRREVANAGAEAYFFKPIELSDFLDSVQNSLARRETVAEAPEIESGDGVGERLSDLRQRFQAEAMLLLNDQGEVVAQAGGLPELVDGVNLIMALMSLTGAAQRVSDLVGEIYPEDYLQVKGQEYTFVLSHVGRRMALLAAISNSVGDDSHWARLLSEFRQAAREMNQVLLKMGVETSKLEQIELAFEPETASEGTDQTVGELDRILKKKTKKNLPAEEVNAFWDAVEDSKLDTPTRKDAISYEQARQLGLAPED
jgi:DNA-binding NarL/FixJ family response regulator